MKKLRGNNILRKKIVISGINLFEGGTLQIYYALLDELKENNIFQNHDVTIFVHKKNLFLKYQTERIEIIELPKSRRNYIYRMFYEYLFFYFYSKKIDIDVWFSVHDISPNVKAKNRYVYCHNSLPLQKLKIKDYYFSPKLILFKWFYSLFYRINIKKNTGIIVQQNWIKNKFVNMYNVSNVIVVGANRKEKIQNLDYLEDELYTFFYPAVSRPFKDFEIICKAIELYNKKRKDEMKFQVFITIDGTENKYSHYIVEKYKHIKQIKFIGFQNFDSMQHYYKISNVLLFPSRAESWGLPLSEFKNFNKPILCSDLPYAHETIGNYDKVKFFQPYNYELLAMEIEKFIKGDYVFSKNTQMDSNEVINWSMLVKKIFK